jgi:1-acyl-sn-glycerol-3-phosphate acyltransferase
VTVAERPETKGRLGWGYRLTLIVCIPILSAIMRRDWRGAENLPRTGGVVAVSVHASNLDPLTFGHFIHGNGRVMRFLAKASLFKVPGFGALLRSAKQIPVHRGGGDAALAFASAVEAVRAGQLVAVFPEGTLTRDPDMWPMRGKTGAARIALTDRRARRPDRSVGGPPGSAALQQAAAPVPAQDRPRLSPARPWTSTTCAGASSTPRSCARPPIAS